MVAFARLIALRSVHAAIVKGALEAEGITVVLDGSGSGGPYALDTGTWATTVMVPADQLDHARQVLAEVEQAADDGL